MMNAPFPQVISKLDRGAESVDYMQTITEMVTSAETSLEKIRDPGQMNAADDILPGAQAAGLPEGVVGRVRQDVQPHVGAVGAIRLHLCLHRPVPVHKGRSIPERAHIEEELVGVRGPVVVGGRPGQLGGLDPAPRAPLGLPFPVRRSLRYADA